jgi:hypothetical protein
MEDEGRLQAAIRQKQAVLELREPVPALGVRRCWHFSSPVGIVTIRLAAKMQPTSPNS